MARRSQRVSSGTAATPGHKRAASGSAPTSSVASQRSKRQKATPTKSQYFEKSGATESAHDEEESNVSASSEDDANASEFEATDNAAEDPSEDGNESDEYDEDSGEALKKRKKATASKGTTSAAAIRTKGKGSELWRSGVKAGLGPGTQVVIKKPKARPAGKTPYQDDTIHPNTMLFLKDLKANNDREWLKMNDAEFRQAERDWHSFVDKITERLVEIDDTIPELPVKDVVWISESLKAPPNIICDTSIPSL